MMHRLTTYFRVAPKLRAPRSGMEKKPPYLHAMRATQKEA